MESTKELETRVMLLQLAIHTLLEAHPLSEKLMKRLASAADVVELEANETGEFLPPSVACPDLVALFKGEDLE